MSKQTKPVQRKGDKRNIPEEAHRTAERVARRLMLMEPKPRRRN